MPRLFDSENFSSSTDLKISESKFKSSTQIGMFLESNKTFFCVICKIGLGIGEKTICFSITPTDSSAELVKWWKPKILCISYNNRISICKIHTIFNNRCREKNITFSFTKWENMILKLFSLHTPMYNSNTYRVSRLFLDSCTNIVNFFAHHSKCCNSIMKYNNLSSTSNFSFNKCIDMLVIPRMNFCNDRFSLSRWRCENRYFLHSWQSHI